MEFEDVSEEIEREARRVATALEKEWEVVDVSIKEDYCNFFVLEGKMIFHWMIPRFQPAQWTYLSVGEANGECEVCFDESPLPPHQKEWQCSGHPAFNHLMTRALYRLGFENQKISSELNSPITAHEKLELRLSMPREFWPQTWRDEQA